MSLEAYKKDLEGRVAEIKDQLKWEVDHEVRTQQRRGGDKEWSDVTAATHKRAEENIELYERIIAAIEQRDAK
ncbi:hypothetical protein G6L74_06160 [Agrobacterium tumefaciens]|uniref:hypothetical protein n=1 Tax=Agrobacterium tumefaciens TaxID=358 RepID=UPI00157487F8|nr:hypothetical protein [Agrobacterium tumefaciens]